MAHLPPPTPVADLESRAVQLRLDGVSLAYADRRVLTNVSLAVGSGERVGLLGENGSGKTTLLRLAAGVLRPDAGTVTVSGPRGLTPRMGLLHQEPPFGPDTTLAQALESAIAPVRAAVDALEAAAHALATQPEDRRVAARYAAALDAAERLEVWDVESRVAAMVAGLGLDGVAPDRPTTHLSGGQRARLSLAWLLLSAPDVLLLDEPTNHLDDAATAHLDAVLAGWRGPVLLASHDRAFLDEAVTALVDLDPAPLPHAIAGPLVGDGDGSGIGVTRFTGSYTGYLHARLDAGERWDARYRSEQVELRRLRAEVREAHGVGHAGREPRAEIRAARKFYADRHATVVSRRVTEAQRRLAALEHDRVRKPPAPLWFRGLTAGAVGATRLAGATGAPGAPGPTTSRRRWSGPVLAASRVALTGRLAPTSLTVSAGERWLVTGPNGSGKSTLLALLARSLTPDAGAVWAPEGLRVGLLTQEVSLPDVAGRGPERTARRAYEDLVGPDVAERVPLAAFGLLPGREENRAVSALSVGQQRRLALAVVLADPPDVLLLDEPTNHLSLVLVTQLEAAIPAYPGAVVVASHDRWLRRAWTGRTLELTAAQPAMS